MSVGFEERDPDICAVCGNVESCPNECVHAPRAASPESGTPSGEPKVHELKVWPEYFRALVDGRKTFEVRLDDRGFREGDTLLLREYRPPDGGDLSDGDYTGDFLKRRISYVMRGGGFIPGGRLVIAEGFVVLGLASPPSAPREGSEAGDFDPHGFLPTLPLERDSLARAAGMAVSTMRSMGGEWLVCRNASDEWAHYAAHQRADAESYGWEVVARVAPPAGPATPEVK